MTVKVGVFDEVILDVPDRAWLEDVHVRPELMTDLSQAQVHVTCQAAGEAALEIIGEGKVVGLVGYATAQNAQDRIAGVNDVLEGTGQEMVEVLLDDIKPEVALSNAQTAMQKYEDMAGFITFYSYDGPAACQAVKQAGREGEIKIVGGIYDMDTGRVDLVGD